MAERGEGLAYGAKGNSGGGEAYQAPITGMRLMNGIGILIAERVEDGLNPSKVLGDDQVADLALESAGRKEGG